MSHCAHIFSHCLLSLCFPSPSHYCSFSSLFVLHLYATCYSSITSAPTVFFNPSTLLLPLSLPFLFLPLPHLCLFNSVTVNHVSSPDTFFSLQACCRGTLADSAPQLHNARRESGRQTSKCTNAPLKRS